MKEPVIVSDPLHVREQRIPPVRGLVAVHNVLGSALPEIDIKRWLRLNRLVHKTEKCDVLVYGAHRVDWPLLLKTASGLDMRLSMRVDCTASPPDLGALGRAGLMDLYVSPAPDAPYFDAWLEAARDAELPLRVQITPPFRTDMDVDAWCANAKAHGVAVVNAALYDPFLRRTDAARGGVQARDIQVLNALAAAAEAHGMEGNLLGLPLCHVTESNLPRAANSPQMYLDHQQYAKGAYDLALRLYGRGSAIIAKAVLMLLAQHTLHRNRIDGFLLPWLLNHPWAYARAVAFQKLVRHRRPFRRTPRAVDNSMKAFEKALAEAREREQQQLGYFCGKCSLRRICDHAAPEFTRLFPRMAVTPVPGDLVVSPQHFCLRQPKYYDPVDRERLGREAEWADLAAEANAILNNRPPDETVSPYHYTVEDAPYDQMEGGTRWHSITNTEKLSSLIGRVNPPFTVSVGFGGGIAEYVGFSFGRHAKILCPMEGHKHEVTLHCAEDGRYVLLRDGQPLRPSTFEGMHYVPMRLGNNLDLRIACWNIDAFVVSQFVRIWRGKPLETNADRIKYSVLIVTTRYARRLQAVLRSIAHQHNFDLSRIEIVVAYVPGLDPTEDLLDSMQLTYPALHIVRCPFPRENANSKGFMINEAVNSVRGEWVMLLDSDTLVPPDMFSRLDAETNGEAVFYAPDGRKMLSRETTHRILLGEVQPWNEWDQLLRDAGEYRYREAKSVPIGFCQVVKTECLREIPYTELDHFEGADMWFGMQMMEKYGKEARLSGLPVLHLDHGGSQWYGASKQF